MPVNKVFKQEDCEHRQLEVFDSGESINYMIVDHKTNENIIICLCPYDSIELIKHIKVEIEDHINSNHVTDSFKFAVNKRLKELFV
jgi:hypothetical protein